MRSLKIALIGYGRMGRMIEHFAIARGHEIVLRLDSEATNLLEVLRSSGAEVAIEFTIPSSAYRNCRSCLDLGIPVVSGTTAWGEGVEELRAYCREGKGRTFLWSSNYSIGVNLFFEMNRLVARLMQGTGGYAVSIREIHHVHKLDAPSGTAITLAENIVQEHPVLHGWRLCSQEDTPEPGMLPIYSVREGEVPGTHTAVYRSEVDEIRLTHEAFGREGFALGAVVAAEYASSHSGDLRMVDVLQHLMSEV